MSALSFMNFETAFERTTGSPSVHAIAVTPLKYSLACFEISAFDGDPRKRVLYDLILVLRPREAVAEFLVLFYRQLVKLTTIADLEF